MTSPRPGDSVRSREPIFNIPFIVVAVAVALLAIHGGLEHASDAAQEAILRNLAFIPGRLTLAFWPEQLQALLDRANSDPSALEQAQALRAFRVVEGGAKFWTLATYAGLHASWTHVGLNTIWLIAFGPPVARRFGSLRFAGFLLVTAVASALAHWAIGPMDCFPLIGASGCDSGLMAAAARFVFQPGGLLGTPRPGAGGGALQPAEVPASTLAGLFAERRAAIFVGIWLATNLIFGAGAQALGVSEAPIAWVAHLGGFVAGLATFSLFDRFPAKSQPGP